MALETDNLASKRHEHHLSEKIWGHPWNIWGHSGNVWGHLGHTAQEYFNCTNLNTCEQVFFRQAEKAYIVTYRGDM
jgi:hypothetical protein